MIKVTRLNNKEFCLNAELIETAEETPDTIVTLSNGRKHIVREKVDVVIERVIAYKRQVLSPLISNR